MEMFAQYTEWANFLSTRVAIAEVDEAQAEAVLQLALDHAMVVSDYGTVTVAKASRSLDSAVIELREKAAVAKAYRKLTTSFFENVERKSAVISRELSRRLGSRPLENRVGRYRP